MAELQPKPEQKVCTRFAPSPTGMLHIGGARTALFNYLQARHYGGVYKLRIEDTDQKRSTPEAVKVILDGLKWLGVEHDGDPVYQSQRIDAHKAAAEKLLAEGKAYKCTCTSEELTAMREEQQKAGIKPMYNQKCRTGVDVDESKPYTVRIKTPNEGETGWDDAVQGRISYSNKELDDFIILRSDGTPTYNLVVVADDADMGVNNVIRGDDHINNTPKQILLYQALGLLQPTFAHIPLIHGDDGKKLSKRHGAVAVTQFRDEGFLPQAVRNYLLQLGWSYKEDMIDDKTAIEKFDIHDVNKGAANFNTKKLEWFNSQYMLRMTGAELLEAITPFLGATPTATQKQRLEKGLPGLAKRAKRLTDLASGAEIYLKERPLAADENAAEALDVEAKERLGKLREALEGSQDWDEESLDKIIADFIQNNDLKMPQVGKPLRAALVGTTNAPSLGEIMVVLGREETLARLTELT